MPRKRLFRAVCVTTLVNGLAKSERALWGSLLQAGRTAGGALGYAGQEKELQLTSLGFEAGGLLQSPQVIVKGTFCPVQPVTASSLRLIQDKSN